MAQISLTRGFTLRKRLRTLVNDFSTSLERATLWIKSKTIYPDKTEIKSNEKPFEYKGKNVAETFALLEKGNEYMLTLNNLIDEANIKEARKVINEIEIQKSKIHLLQTLSREMDSFVESNTIYDTDFTSDGSKTINGLITEKYIRTNDFDWKKEYEETRKNIVMLEDKLTDINGTTTFNCPDEIISFIRENI